MKQSYLKSKAPYLILIGLFIVLPLLDSILMYENENNMIVIRVEQNRIPEIEQPPTPVQLAEVQIQYLKDE